MQRLITTIAAAAMFAGAALPALADEIEETLEAALDAYRAGDIQMATEELDYAKTLLSQQKADTLSRFLPAALDGWEREDDTQGATAAAQLFGGGLMASAAYTDGSETVSIQLMADNQMVAAMAPMFANPSLLAQMGKIERIERQMVVVTPEGDFQTLINNRIMIQLDGSAPAEVKRAYFEAIDIAGLKAF